MIRRLISIILILAFSLSCKKYNKYTQFNLVFDENIAIPGLSILNLPFTIFTPDIPVNVQNEFESHDTRKDLIEKIRLEKMILTIKSPANGTFNFVKNVELFIGAEGMQEARMAYKTNMTNNNVSEITLDMEHTDFSEYIKKDKFSLRCAVTTDEINTEEYDVNVHFVLFVDAKLKKK